MVYFFYLVDIINILENKIRVSSIRIDNTLSIKEKLSSGRTLGTLNHYQVLTILRLEHTSGSIK